MNVLPWLYPEMLVRAGLGFWRCCDDGEARIKEGIRGKWTVTEKREITLLKNSLFTEDQIF